MLFLVEVAFVPTYEREGAADWIVQIAALVVGLTGLLAAVMWFLQRRARAGR